MTAPSPAAVMLGVAALLLAMPALAQDSPPPGATACGGCHPRAIQGPVVPLDGMPASAIIDAMQAFRSGSRPATVMDRIARGFSEAETAALAAFFAGKAKP